MNNNLNDDLQYIASAVRRQDKPVGVPIIFFMWAALIAVGFALPEHAPQYAGWFWLVAGIGGGLLSWYLGARAEKRSGIRDMELGKRYGLHWLIGGAAYILVSIPMLTGKVPLAAGASYYLLVTGLLYALAGIHLQRGLLLSGLVSLAGFAVLSLVEVPYTWTLTGLVIAVSLVLAGLSAQRAIRNGALA